MAEARAREHIEDPKSDQGEVDRQRLGGARVSGSWRGCPLRNAD
jgi:hypothetical protein